MNAVDRSEISDLRAYINKLALSGFGLMVSVAISVVGWELSQEGRVSATAQIAQDARDTSRENRRSIAESGREISAMASQVQAQGRTLDRIDRNLMEITQFLRGGSAR